MPNPNRRTRRIKPLIDSGELTYVEGKTDPTYLDTSEYWKGDEGERFLDLGQITTVVGPTMANDPTRFRFAMACAVSVLKGSDTASVAVISDRSFKDVKGEYRAAGFDTPDTRDTARFRYWQPRSGWWRDALGPARARELYAPDLASINFDLIIVVEPADASAEHWEWLLNLGKDKTSHPAVLIVTDYLDDETADDWTMTVDHESPADLRAVFSRGDEQWVLSIRTNSDGKRKTRFNRKR